MLALYIKPTYKYGMLLDTGYYTHHFVYTGPPLNASSTEIPFSGYIAYPSPTWKLAAFQFPSNFFMSIDIRTAFATVGGDPSQVIFRKLKSGKRKKSDIVDGTVFLELDILVHSKTTPADLVVTTQTETKTFQGYFPVNTNGSYVEIDISFTGANQLIVYQNGVPNYDNPVTSVGNDDANNVSLIYNQAIVFYIRWSK